MKNYYILFNLPQNCTQKQIRRTYLKLCLLWHPDKNSSPKAVSKFQLIKEGYDILYDPISKQQYDKKLQTFLKSQKKENTFKKKFNDITIKIKSFFSNFNGTAIVQKIKQFNKHLQQPEINIWIQHLITQITQQNFKIPKKCPITTTTIHITYEDYYNLKTFSCKIPILTRCSICEIQSNMSCNICKGCGFYVSDKYYELPLQKTYFLLKNQGHSMIGYSEPSDLQIVIELI